MTTADSGESRDKPTRSGWVFGVALILLGSVFLLQNAGMPVLTDNWWALFILIPAMAVYSTAWAAYQSDGDLTPRVLSLIMGGTIPLVIALVFLFKLDFGQWWPALLIMAGAAALVGGDYRTRRGRRARRHHATSD